MRNKLKLITCLLVITVLTTGLLAACGSKSEESKDKKYLIGTDTTFAPFEFQDENGDYVGVDVEILAAIADDQGFKYELKPLGFDAAVGALEANQVDAVIAGMSITSEREKKYDFSAPYYDSGVVMAITADNDGVKSYDDLKGKKVAVKNGTESATFAESIKDKYGFEVTYFDESPLMYQEVLAKNSAACFEDYPVMGYGISQGNGLKIVTDMESGSSYGFAVLKGKNTELLEQFDAGLKNIKENGTYEEIINKYIVKE
ncbi:MAG: transporter substrate-binding domain-containing protein [Clostridiales Family XIII bacterium]|jgi:polar amino acid transport system substrate-binding protein|nr:transporter substrate-binding domain-containing protein [Clostridiales Family XIII bacterium]